MFGAMIRRYFMIRREGVVEDECYILDNESVNLFLFLMHVAAYAAMILVRCT